MATWMNRLLAQKSTPTILTLATAATCLMLSGCHHGYYTPSSLPHQFQASASRDPELINWTNISSQAAAENRIDPGDLLEVTILSGIEDGQLPAYPLRVAENGTVNVPLIGPAHVAGLELVQAEQAITQLALRKEIYRNPTVSVQMKERKTNRVTVMGPVKKPGTYALRAANSTLFDAIVAANGLDDNADTVVEVRNPPAYPSGNMLPRTDGPGIAGDASNDLVGYQQPLAGGGRPESVLVNLASTKKDDLTKRPLEDGAVVMVHRQEPKVVHVMGLVNNAGQFEVPGNQDIHLLDAIAMARGRTMQLANKVCVVRNVPGQSDPVIIQLSVKDAKSNTNSNLRLMDGDVVSVEETPLTFTIETLRSFIRFGFSSTLSGI